MWQPFQVRLDHHPPQKLLHYSLYHLHCRRRNRVILNYPKIHRFRENQKEGVVHHSQSESTTPRSTQQDISAFACASQASIVTYSSLFPPPRFSPSLPFSFCATSSVKRSIPKLWLSPSRASCRDIEDIARSPANDLLATP